MVLDRVQSRLAQMSAMNTTSTPVAAGPDIAPLVERIETLLVDLPTIRPHKLSVATMNGQTLMLVKIHCSDGIVGIGEGTTIGGLAYGDESPEGMKLAIDTYFAPVMVGQDATRVQALMARLGKMVKENRFAKSAVETALLDAHGKRLGLAGQRIARRAPPRSPAGRVDARLRRYGKGHRRGRTDARPCAGTGSSS